MNTSPKFNTKVIAIFTLLLFSLNACKNEAEVKPILNKFSIEDFKKQDNFWNYSEVDNLIKESKLGHIPEMAFVPLVFNAKGNLLTAEEFNSQVYADLTYYATDLETFYEVTKETTALPDYALVLDKNGDKAVFAYDPYAKEKLTRTQDYQKILETIGNTPLVGDENVPFARTESTITNFNAGDFIVRPNNILSYMVGSSPVPSGASGSSWGHAVGVTQGLLSSTDPATLLANTWIMEAWGNEVGTACQLRETRANVAGSSSSCTNNPIQNDNYWNKFTHRFRLRANITSTQRNIIVSFMRQQDPDTYSYSASKRFRCNPPPPCFGAGCVAPPPQPPICSTSSWADGNTWYCSLLVWQAYLFATGVDIDSNGGIFVFPNDVINSATFNNTSTDLSRRIRF
jgi:hypothetical protein